MSDAPFLFRVPNLAVGTTQNIIFFLAFVGRVLWLEAKKPTP
jgi:hypothetical protein